MGLFIVHHEGKFFEWSTIVDAPVTDPMTRSEFDHYYRAEYGARAFREEYPARIARALKFGSSSHMRKNLFDLVKDYNRYRPESKQMTLDEMWADLNK